MLLTFSFKDGRELSVLLSELRSGLAAGSLKLLILVSKLVVCCVVALLLGIQPFLHDALDLRKILGQFTVFLSQHAELYRQLIQLGLVVVLAGCFGRFLFSSLLHAFHLFDELVVALLKRVDLLGLASGILCLLEGGAQFIDLLVLSCDHLLDVTQGLVLLLILVLALVEILHGSLKLHLGLRLLMSELIDGLLLSVLLLLELSNGRLQVGALLQQHLVLLTGGTEALVL